MSYVDYYLANQEGGQMIRLGYEAVGPVRLAVIEVPRRWLFLWAPPGTQGRGMYGIRFLAWLN